MPIHPIIVQSHVAFEFTDRAKELISGDIAAQAGQFAKENNVRTSGGLSKPKALGLAKDSDGVFVIKLSETSKLWLPNTPLGKLVNELAFSAAVPFGCKLQLSERSQALAESYNKREK